MQTSCYYSYRFVRADDGTIFFHRFNPLVVITHDSFELKVCGNRINGKYCKQKKKEHEKDTLCDYL